MLQRRIGLPYEGAVQETKTPLLCAVFAGCELGAGGFVDWAILVYFPPGVSASHHLPSRRFDA